jgi:hypothetical protein
MQRGWGSALQRLVAGAGICGVAVWFGLLASAGLAKGPGGSGGSGGSKGGGGSTSTTIYLTTVVHDFALDGTELLERSDDWNGTGQATYSNALNAGVTAVINSSGIWHLDLLKQSTGIRTLWITPNDVYNSSAASVPGAAYYWQSVETYSGCQDANGNTVPIQNVVTSSGNCSMGVDFGYNGVTYKLFMGPVLPGPGPATGLVTVTCNSASGGQCVSWTIVPNMAAPNPEVANLYSYTGGPKSPWVFIGQYYNTFRIDSTNP